MDDVRSALDNLLTVAERVEALELGEQEVYWYRKRVARFDERRYTSERMGLFRKGRGRETRD